MRLPAVGSVCLCLSVCLARAEAPADAEEALAVQQLRKISVTATRGPRELGDIAGTVTIKSAAEIEAELATDIRDLIRYEPGISVSNAPSSA